MSARILSISPVHPNRQKGETQLTNPSRVRFNIDIGLKSGKLVEVNLSLDEAIRASASLVTSVAQAFNAIEREGSDPEAER